MSSSSPPEWDSLLSACQKNQPEKVRHLIEKEGVSPNHANKINQSALHIAALWGHSQCVAILLELGASVQAKNKLTGATPLHVAVQCSSKGSFEERKKCIQLLLEAGGPNAANVGDFYGSIPADYCKEEPELLKLVTPTVPQIFEARNAQEMETLLQNDETAVSARYMNKTPLISVVDKLLLESKTENEDSKQLVEMLQVLLKHGADPNETCTVHRNGHLVAQEDVPEDPSLTRICLELREAYRQELSVDRTSILESAARLLHQFGATVDSQLLLDAARRNHVPFAKFLIQEMDVSPNTKMRQGMTALQFAARSGKVEMVSYLLQETDIDVYSKDDRGQSALDAARVNDKQDVVVMLEDYMSRLEVNQS